MDDPGLLTADEHELLELLGQVANRFRIVILESSTEQTPTLPTVADFDWNEVAVTIHDLQARVMAQAAARAYPDLYRRLGGRPPRMAEHHYRPEVTTDG
jgi:hypothetical protein